ncbi:hypothetical protein K501DRAFT_203338, partial [Backusella circina FSU 941]
MSINNVTNKRPRASTVAPEGLEAVSQPRRKRAPLRYLTVRTKRHDIWSKISETNSGLSVSDWLAMDKAAMKDLVDGIRYLKSRNRSMGKRQQSEQDANETDSEYDDLLDFTETDIDGDNLSDRDSDSDYDDFYATDTEPYAYDNESMYKSAPLRGVLCINGVMIPDCVIDTGASVSVMNASLAESIGLMKGNGDKMRLCS